MNERSIFLSALPELQRALGIDASWIRPAISGLLLLVVILFLPGGLSSLIPRARTPRVDPDVRAPDLPPLGNWAKTIADYRSTGMTLDRHPMSLLRSRLRARRLRDSRELAQIEHGTQVAVAGIVTGRQRPQTASGITFVTLEDEHGMVNVVVWHHLAERQRRVLVESQLMEVRGRLEAVDGVRHLIAQRLQDLTPWLGGLDSRSRDFK